MARDVELLIGFWRRRKLGVAVPLVVAILLAVVFVWELRSAGHIAVDDSYITFSFSKNLAAGKGPLYGYGERVEGYSNFLWMVAVAIGLLVNPRNAEPLLVARAVAVPFVLLLGYASYRLARVHASRLLSLAVLAVLVAYGDVSTAFLLGLETLAMAALLTLAFLLYVLSLGLGDYGRRLRPWVVPAFVAVALTRIDGFIPLGFVLGVEAARRVWRREGRLRDYVRWAAPGVGVYLLWFAWRWVYYGLPLPTTYYAKSMIPTLMPDRGYWYVKSETLANGSLAVLPLMLGSFTRRRRLASLILVSFVALHAYYVVRTGGDWMPYGRFLLPILPLTLVIAAWGGEGIVQALRSRVGKLASVARLLPLAALAYIVQRTERHLTHLPLQLTKFAEANGQGQHVQNLKFAARLLSAAIPPGGRLVTDFGGVFAYYTDADPIEMWGLCNAMIAIKGGTDTVNPIYGRTCPECYPALDPQFFHTIPIPHAPQYFHSHAQVVSDVWQADTIGRYIDLQRGFVSGRVLLAKEHLAVFFLEQRHPGKSYRPRRASAEIVVDYPFEPEGRALGL